MLDVLWSAEHNNLLLELHLHRMLRPGELHYNASKAVVSSTISLGARHCMGLDRVYSTAEVSHKLLWAHLGLKFDMLPPCQSYALHYDRFFFSCGVQKLLKHAAKSHTRTDICHAK